MRKFLIASTGFILVVFVMSGLLSIVSVKKEDVTQLQIQNVQTKTVDTKEWRKVVSNIEAYQLDVIEKQNDAELAAEKARLAKLQTQKKMTLDDAKLIGAILGLPRKAIIILPDKAEPSEIKEGGVWLSPWFLKEVHADYIVWQNTETEALKNQQLFK